MRRGFTLLELLVVIGVILALMALAYPIISYMRERANIAATRVEVHAVVAAMAGSGVPRAVSGRDGTGYNVWAVGCTPGDTEIDGDPSRYPPTHALAVRAPASYTGFVRMTGCSVPANARGQPVDRWQRPLHIFYAAYTYLPDGYGVWSTGPKGVGDDINSWTNGEK